MRVWVAEQGRYSSRGIVGVYATPEAAMADNPIPAKLAETGKWTESDGCWTNGLEWDDLISIEPWEVKE